jgi:hypothetical protein
VVFTDDRHIEREVARELYGTVSDDEAVEIGHEKGAKIVINLDLYRVSEESDKITLALTAVKTEENTQVCQAEEDYDCPSGYKAAYIRLQGEDRKSWMERLVGNLTEPFDEGLYNQPRTPRLTGYVSSNILEKLHIQGNSPNDIKKAFTALHTYLSSRTPEQVEHDAYLKTGDYIDLASLTVPDSYVWSHKDRGYVDSIHTVTNTDFDKNASAVRLNAGSSLRLILVGVNSFRKTNPDAPAHVVFQFKNVPFGYYMNKTGTNAGGYEASAMRRFLLNNFLPALEKTGLPVSVLWAPRRMVGGDEIEDKLWLPTERELFGPVGPDGHFISSHFKYGPWAHESETESNQAWLEYYSSDSARYKSSTSNSWFGDWVWWYWGASPCSGSAAAFCYCNDDGNFDGYNASAVGGCAPAFCVR